jgi:DNA-binding winged helix-turn-helix (wHTH) protein
MDDAVVHRKLRFGPFELSIGERVLRRDGRVLPLGDRALDILTYLADRPGVVIAKQKLIDHVWSDVTVEEGSLRVHIAAIRKALGDGQFGNRYIANIKGRGYAFVGTVVPLAGNSDSGNDYVALGILGCLTVALSGDFDTAREMVDRTVASNPDSSHAWELRGWTYVIAGQPEEASRSFARTIRLSPSDSSLFSTFIGIGAAFIGLGRFEERQQRQPGRPSGRTRFIRWRIVALQLPWLIYDVKQKRERQQTVCSNSNPVFVFLNGLPADGYLRSISTASAKPDYQSDAPSSRGGDPCLAERDRALAWCAVNQIHNQAPRAPLCRAWH